MCKCFTHQPAHGGGAFRVRFQLFNLARQPFGKSGAQIGIIGADLFQFSIDGTQDPPRNRSAGKPADQRATFGTHTRFNGAAQVFLTRGQQYLQLANRQAEDFLMLARCNGGAQNPRQQTRTGGAGDNPRQQPRQ